MRRWRDRVRRMIDYAQRRTELPGAPKALMLETTVRCNLRCPMCPRTFGSYPGDSNADLPDALLYGVLEAFAALGGDSVMLFGLGEPLMDPRIFDVLRRARQLGLTSLLSTNGTFLDKSTRAKLLANPCDQLIISIDAATEATYRTYRVGGDYHQVVRNLEALAREKQQAQVRLSLVPQLVRMPGNLHEEGAFRRRWASVPGITAVRFKDEDIGISKHALHTQDAHLRQNPCYMLWSGMMVVRYTGLVYPCFPIGEVGEPLGNLRTSSLGALWNAPELRRLRGLHGEGQSNAHPVCQVCTVYRPTTPAVLGGMALSGAAMRRALPMAERLGRWAPRLLSERRNRHGEG